MAGAYQLNGQLVIPECKPTYGGRYICTVRLVNGLSRVAYTTLIISPDEQVPQPDDGIYFAKELVCSIGVCLFTCDAISNNIVYIDGLSTLPNCDVLDLLVWINFCYNPVDFALLMSTNNSCTACLAIQLWFPVWLLAINLWKFRWIACISLRFRCTFVLHIFLQKITWCCVVLLKYYAFKIIIGKCLKIVHFYECQL